MAIHPKAQEFADFIAALPKSEREKFAAQTNQLVLNKIPEEEVGSAPVRPLGEYLDDPIETAPLIVGPGLVARGGISVLFGRSGYGKSAITMNCAVRWACGKSLFDELPEVLAPEKPLKILIIENEGAAAFFQKTMDKIVNNGHRSKEDVDMIRENIYIWGDGGYSELKLDNAKYVQILHQAVAEVQPDLIIMEPFRGLWDGDENSNETINKVTSEIVKLATTYQCGVWLVHHEVKNFEGSEQMDAMRGASALDGVVGVIFRWRPVRGGDYRELHQVKHRYDQPIAPVRMEFDYHTWGYKLVDDSALGREIIEAIMENGNAWTPISDLAESLQESQDNVRKAATIMHGEGKIERKKMAGGMHYRVKEGDGPKGALET